MRPTKPQKCAPTAQHSHRDDFHQSKVGTKKTNRSDEDFRNEIQKPTFRAKQHFLLRINVIHLHFADENKAQCMTATNQHTGEFSIRSSREMTPEQLLAKSRALVAYVDVFVLEDEADKVTYTRTQSDYDKERGDDRND